MLTTVTALVSGKATGWSSSGHATPGRPSTLRSRLTASTSGMLVGWDSTGDPASVVRLYMGLARTPSGQIARAKKVPTTPTPSRPFSFSSAIPLSKGPSLFFSSSTGPHAHTTLPL